MSVMLTVWGKQLDRKAPLPEYPRPQMVRNSYVNLNGLWDYAFTDSPGQPPMWDGHICVPFSPEAPLSGVKKLPRKWSYLHYLCRFTLPDDFVKDRVLLHFGAVDQKASVWLNGKELGCHESGYLPFSFDCTAALKPGENVLHVAVQDDVSDPCFARGKQSAHPGGIWYTAQSGIWQTVWLESVPEVYIKNIRLTPEYDAGRIRIELESEGSSAGATADVFDGERFVAGSWFKNGVCVIPLPGFRSWSPEDPFLYSLRITLASDRVDSYFAMRKFSYTIHDSFKVFALNGKPYFHNGLLDQGYWPDGLLTPPSDQAMIFDIQTAKDCGFNMLRKHIKIEPMRWYYHCDRLGMLVWQDMVSGGGWYSPLATSILPTLGLVRRSDSYSSPFGRGRAASRAQFEKEWRATVTLLYNVPSIALWTPFNEGWGQFDAARIAEEVRKADRTRYIDHASGWHDQGRPEIQSKHIYFRPLRLINDGRALCLTEFGGYTLAVAGHMWCQRPFGYKQCADAKALAQDWRQLYENQLLPAMQREGLTAAVYTQLTDVEQEMNGLLTYDRRVRKLDTSLLQEINSKLRFVGEAEKR